MLHFNKNYFLLTILLFVIEVCIALFVHDVHTTVQWDGETNTLEEAETILLKRNDQDQWRAVYEHLSPKIALEQA